MDFDKNKQKISFILIIKFSFLLNRETGIFISKSYFTISTNSISKIKAENGFISSKGVYIP